MREPPRITTSSTLPGDERLADKHDIQYLTIRRCFEGSKWTRGNGVGRGVFDPDTAELGGDLDSYLHYGSMEGKPNLNHYDSYHGHRKIQQDE